jgi:hypothetical protein
MGRTKELLEDMRQQEVDRLDVDYEYELWLAKVRANRKSLTRTTEVLDNIFEGFAMAIKHGQEQSKNYN